MTLAPPSKRPIGVTVLAGLMALGAVFGIAAAVALLFGLVSLSSVAAGFGVSDSTISSTAAALGILVYTAIAIPFAYGAWTLQPWAWWLGLVLFAISALSDLLAGVAGIIGLAYATVSVMIAAVVIYYWLRPRVRAAFRRS